MIRWLLHRAGFAAVVIELDEHGQPNPDDIDLALDLLETEPPGLYEELLWSTARSLYRLADWFGTLSARASARHLETEHQQ